jgi:hypothetical protein
MNDNNTVNKHNNKQHWLLLFTRNVIQTAGLILFRAPAGYSMSFCTNVNGLSSILFFVPELWPEHLLVYSQASVII